MDSLCIMAGNRLNSHIINQIIDQMCRRVFTFIILLALSVSSYCQEQYSDEEVMVDGFQFMPYSRGEVKYKLSGPWETEIERFSSIISTWKGISPPKGFEVVFSGINSSFEIIFAAYIKREEKRTTHSSTSILLSINNPAEICGMPLVEGIFIKPSESGYFYGFPRFSINNYDTFVITKLSIPIFVQATREEYLRALIAKAEKDYPESEKLTDSRISNSIEEIEKAYRQLLEVDKAAAEELKKGMEMMKKEAKGMVSNDDNYYPALLKKELDKMPENERKLPAYYSLSAIDQKISVSGLVRINDNKYADTLVKVNPALDRILCNSKEARMLIVHIQHEPGELGFRLADSKIRELMNNELIWRKIYESIK